MGKEESVSNCKWRFEDVMRYIEEVLLENVVFFMVTRSIAFIVAISLLMAFWVIKI